MHGPTYYLYPTNQPSEQFSLWFSLQTNPKKGTRKKTNKHTHSVAGQNPSPPKKPWNDDSPVHTNPIYGVPWFQSGAAPLQNHGKPLFVGFCRGIIILWLLRWCRISQPSTVSLRSSSLAPGWKTPRREPSRSPPQAAHQHPQGATAPCSQKPGASNRNP